MTRSARIAVVGLGRIGALHARNVALRACGCELAWVVDVRADRAHDLGEELGVASAATLDAVMEDPEVDGVIVATPTPTHAALVHRAAHHRKHVLCEKPIALELAPTWSAVRAARDAGVHLQLGFQRRFDPDLIRVHEAVVGGQLGEIRSFRSTHRNARPPEAMDAQALGGVLVDVAIHDFDLARWLVGEIVEVSAMGVDLAGSASNDAAAAAHAVTILRFATGVIGTVESSRTVGYGFDGSVELVGTDATIRVGGQRHADDVEWLTPGRATTALVADHAEWHREAYVRELEHFARVIEGDLPPSVSGEDGAAAFVVASAASQSLREGRPVKLRTTETPV
ncbi:MAG TPA: Gfo/Idh/MocA family oxidoreductase [Solirubrobacteraceae bacterium]